MTDFVVNLDAADMLVEPNTQPFLFTRGSDLTKEQKRVNWLLPNIIEQGSLSLLFGEPTAGKSLFALDWGFCIAHGLPWEGIKTKQANVAVIAGEGFSGLSKRLKALEIKHGRTTPDNLIVSQAPANLMDLAVARNVAKAIGDMLGDVGLIIVDTMHRNMLGDENSSRDISEFINNIDRAFKPLGAAILIVHHSGHADKTRSRGSSAIKGAMDAEFSATKNESGIVLTCCKAKDFEPFEPKHFKLEVVELPGWTDDTGQTETSVFLSGTGKADKQSLKPKLTARERMVMQSLHDAIRTTGQLPGTEIKAKFAGFDGLMNQGRTIVAIESWRPYAYKVLSVDATDDKKRLDAQRKAFKRSREALINKGLIIEYDGFVWPLFNRTDTDN